MNRSFCSHCGQEHPAAATFCSETGRPLLSAPAAPVHEPQAAAPNPYAAAPNPYAAAPNPYAAAPNPYAAAPNPSVRHNYPLAIDTSSFATAVGLLMKTLPYALARFGVLFAVSIVTIIWYLVAFGGWFFLGKSIHPGVGFGWFIVCCAVFGYFWRLVVRYFLYLLKCGHIVVLTELITKGRIDDGGKGMFAYGKERVLSRFGQVNILFAVDALVKGVVRTFNRTLDFVANLLPLPGLASIVSFVNAVIYAATTYIDESIFSYGLAREEANPWANAKDGLIYYAQNSKEILKTGVFIVILDKVLTGLIWIVMLAPAFVFAALLPHSLAGGGFLFAFVLAALLAANVRSAFLQPLFLVMVMIKFHVQVQNQPINREWDARLTGISDKFRELSGKIAGYEQAPAPSAI
jgi:hypothetical protein